MIRFFLVCLAICAQPLFAQTIIPIESDKFSIVLQIDDSKRLRQVYFGEKLKQHEGYQIISGQLRYEGVNEDIFNHAYTPNGTWNIAEPALNIVHSDGNPSTELEYVSHSKKRVKGDVYLTTINLIDPVYKTEIKLFYKVYRNEDVFEQWSSIKNMEQGPIDLKKYASANLYFRNEGFFLTHYHGSWAEEMKPETHKLTSGIKVLDSKLGTRANLYSPSSFMLSLEAESTEETGKVILANLAWSGNYRFEFEVDRYRNLRLIAGINPHSAEYRLMAGETLDTARFIYTYSEEGRGLASRNMHRWARKYRILDGEGERLTLLNNWEATYFDFDENKITALFDGAKELGVDMFLLDDGWFANKYPRNNDDAGLGDWQENKEKLPSGIGYLLKEATERDIKFGIWIEPEMVNPKSELYETHPDWVIRQPERKEIYYRNQLVLDLSNPEVQDHVFGVVDDLFTQNPGIAYIKWDANSVIYNAYSEYLSKQNLPQTQLYTAYVKGLYTVLERVRKKYPKVPIMLCAGGGGRVDYGALEYFTEFWVSDNTGPIDRVFLQWENSHFYPAISMSAHVTDWDKKANLKYKTDVASMGKLGFDIVVDELDERDKAFAIEAVKNYNSIRDVIWKGDLYRLQDPYSNSFASLQYVNQDKKRAVVFSYLIDDRFKINYSVEPIRLKGLNPKKEYRVTELNLYSDSDSPFAHGKIYSGDVLMKIGINPDVSAIRDSVVLQLEVVN